MNVRSLNGNSAEDPTLFDLVHTVKCQDLLAVSCVFSGG